MPRHWPAQLSRRQRRVAAVRLKAVASLRQCQIGTRRIFVNIGLIALEIKVGIACHEQRHGHCRCRSEMDQQRPYPAERRPRRRTEGRAAASCRSVRRSRRETPRSAHLWQGPENRPLRIGLASTLAAVDHNVKCHRVFKKRRETLADDVEDEKAKKQRRDAKRRSSLALEPAFGAIALGDEFGADLVVRGAIVMNISHIVPGISARRAMRCS